jgi:hypothetical protein
MKQGILSAPDHGQVSKVTIILDHLSRTPFEDGPPYSAADTFVARQL